MTATAVWLVLNRASRSVQAFAEKSIAGLGIGLTDFGILEMLLHKGAMSMSMASLTWICRGFVKLSLERQLPVFSSR